MRISAKSIQRAQAALDAQGFLVMFWLDGPEPIPKSGDILPGPISGTPGPFVVIGTATIEEYDSQIDRFHDPLHQQYAKTQARRAIAFFKLIAE